MVVMLPVIFMAGPGRYSRRPHERKAEKGAEAKIAKEKKLEVVKSRKIRIGNIRNDLGTRLIGLKHYAEAYGQARVGPELKKTAFGKHKGTLFGRTRFKRAAKVADKFAKQYRGKSDFIKGKKISRGDARRGSRKLEKEMAEKIKEYNGLVEEHNKLVEAVFDKDLWESEKLREVKYEKSKKFWGIVEI